MTSAAKLKCPSNNVGAMPASRAALSPFGLSRYASPAKPTAAIAQSLTPTSFCASGELSLSPNGPNDEGETNEQWRLDGYGQQQQDIDQSHFDRRRRRDGLNRPRKTHKQGSGAAGNPKPQTEVARSGPRHSTVANVAAPSPSPDNPRPIAGPSPSFIARTRNPELEPPARFEPTLKREGDVIL